MSMPVFTPVETGDGSSTFYSETFGEWFHSRSGACHEAQATYVETTRLAQRVRSLPAGKSLRILDVCYGLGYNTAAALETIWSVDAQCPVEVMALEIDIAVPRSAIAQNLTQAYAPAVQQTLQDLATQYLAQHNNLQAQLLLGDARQQIQPLTAKNWKADAIFLDPFSPPHCPQLWTVEFISLVAQCLHPDRGTLVTYSCAAAVRAALTLAGLSIGSLHTSARKWPGTIACYDPTHTLPPLSQQEQEHLQTRAAVPYRDPTLGSTAEDILKRRSREQATSELMPTGPWRARWKQQSKALGTEKALNNPQKI